MIVRLKQHALPIFCYVSILLQIAQIFYFERSFFLNSFDKTYWKDRYEHSQYTLPLSKRIIGDDGVYAYAGYRIMQGDSNETILSFKPPVGIYLIGISIALFKNPIFLVFALGIFSLIIFYLIVIE